MKVLVTGATGFLGQWLVRSLTQEGLDVRILKRPKTPLEDLQGLRLDVVAGDVTDPTSVAAACQGIDSVFHLAGLVGYTRAARAAMEKVNVGGTQNVIAACRQHKVRRLVHMSSVVAVGASLDGLTPLNEESPYTIEHLNLGYFETKRKAEQLVMAAVKNHGLDAVAVNPSTIYGAGDAKKGSRQTQLKVAQGKMPFYTSGGVSIVAVEDVVAATIQAWKTGRTGERYLLAGDNITIKELFEIIAQEARVRPPSILLPNTAVHILGKVGDTLELVGMHGPLNSESAWTSTLFHWFDHSKAQRDLGFHPRPAREALRESIEWIRQQGLLS